MKRTGTRFRRRLAANHYDAIVIGSGIGGLTTAALLSKLGKRVCVLEQHYTAGGYTHSYEREGTSGMWACITSARCTNPGR